MDDIFQQALIPESSEEYPYEETFLYLTEPHSTMPDTGGPSVVGDVLAQRVDAREEHVDDEIQENVVQGVTQLSEEGREEISHDYNVVEERNVDGSSRDGESATPGFITIESAIKQCNPRHKAPTDVLLAAKERKATKILLGIFIAGYVLASNGTVKTQPGSSWAASSKRTTRKGTHASPSKKQKIAEGAYHSLLIADDKNILKVRGSYKPTSSSEQINSVRRLAEMPERSFICIVLETGPLELRSTLQKYKKYMECSKEIKVQIIKAKILNLVEEPTAIPTFTPCRGDAVDADTWYDIDTIVKEGDSFEINGSFAVIDIQGRHDPYVSAQGTKFLRGTLQDRTGEERSFTVWNHISAFLDALPDNVNRIPKVVELRRLRIKIMTHAAYGNPKIYASIATNTSFVVLNRNMKISTKGKRRSVFTLMSWIVSFEVYD